MARDDDTFECPVCGADVPADAIVCPECGSDDETGWSEETAYDGLDLPTGYDEDAEGDEKPLTMSPIWKLVAWGLLALIVFMLIASIW